MKTTTIIAASAAIFGSVNAASHVQMMGHALNARDWKDSNNVPTAPVDGGEDKPTKPVDGGEEKPTKPAFTKPVDGGEDEDKPTTKPAPTKPVGGGEGDEPTTKPSWTKPVGGGEGKPTTTTTEAAETTWADVEDPVGGGKGKTTTTTTTTEAAETTWADVEDPVGGGKGKTTTTTSEAAETTWADVEDPVGGGKGKTTTTTTTTTTSVVYWGDHDIPSESTTTKPVGGGEGKPSWTKPVGGGEGEPTTTKPVGGGEGKPSWTKPVGGGEGEPTTTKPVGGGEGKPTGSWGDVPSNEDDEDTVTITKTTTHTVTKYIDGEVPHTWEDVPSLETTTAAGSHTWEDVPSVETTTPAGSHTWEDVPSVETTTAPADPKTWEDVPSVETTSAVNSWEDANKWASSVPAGAGVDECIITVITKYGKPTWKPTPADPVAETPAHNTWEDVPAVETPAHNTWEDVPSVETTTAPADPKTWEDVPSVETTTTAPADHTWEDVPSVETTTAPADPKTWEDVPSVETTTAEHKPWEDVPSVETTTTAPADHTWEDVPSVETTTSADPKTWEDVPSVETTTSADPKTWEDVPSVKTTTTAPAGAVHTWADAAIPTGDDSKPVSGGNGNHEELGSSDSKWAVTYAPYTDDHQCKSDSQIEKEIGEIAAKGFSAVRVYSTGCKTLEIVGGACEKLGLKIILGVFIDEKGIEASKSQLTEIIAWGKWQIVELVILGNEAVFNGHASASDLKAFIISGKASLKQAGYNGPVGTTETLAEWEKDGASWCDAVDVVTANLYAFFNPNTVAEDAGKLIADQIALLKGICPGKKVVITESGWPTQGKPNGKAVPSKENQKKAVDSIIAADVGKSVVWFSFFDEGFKPDGPLGVEKYWGLKDCF